ncbi:MAG: SsrA-binding protein SmpB [Verrucomicrobia bacterium]|nr:SsrA-binding protein SmpB [Verrucomicrobiota bacterium]
MKTIEIQNRKAGHNFAISESVEAGIVLTGAEIKSLRAGGGDLAHAYGKIENGEAWLYSFHIAPYSHGNRANLETERPRKLLLHRNEIIRFLGQIEKKGSRALVPLKGYLKNGRFKILVGLGTGKTHRDRRQDLIKRQTDREVNRVLADRRRK